MVEKNSSRAERNQPTPPLKVLDLFSGIGGFSLGLHRAGMQTVAFCEIEPYPQAVLRKNFPGVPIYDDVRTVTAERLRTDGIDRVDVICGGFPCQPFSVAGKQRGKEDHRHLWPEMFRIVQEFQPAWVIGENVAGFVNMALCDVSSDLEGIGYEVQPFVIPACAADAPHRRDRVWIVAHSGREGIHQRWQFADAQREGVGQAGVVGYGFPQGCDSKGEIMAYSKELFRNGRNGEPECEISESGNCSGTGREYQRWAIEPSVGRVANGVPRRMDRLKCLGNSVVPQIPEIIGRAIIAVMEKEQQ